VTIASRSQAKLDAALPSSQDARAVRRSIPAMRRRSNISFANEPHGIMSSSRGGADAERTGADARLADAKAAMESKFWALYRVARGPKSRTAAR